MRTCGSDGASDATEKAVLFGWKPKFSAARLSSSSCEGLTRVDARAEQQKHPKKAEVVETVGGWLGGGVGVFSAMEGRGEERREGERAGDALVHRDGNCVQALGLRTKQAGRESGEAKTPLYQGLNRKTAHQSFLPGKYGGVQPEPRGQSRSVMEVCNGMHHTNQFNPARYSRISRRCCLQKVSTAGHLYNRF
jgi:hypothetical protein